MFPCEFFAGDLVSVTGLGYTVPAAPHIEIHVYSMEVKRGLVREGTLPNEIPADGIATVQFNIEPSGASSMDHMPPCSHTGPTDHALENNAQYDDGNDYCGWLAASTLQALRTYPSGSL